MEIVPYQQIQKSWILWLLKDRDDYKICTCFSAFIHKFFFIIDL